jgi:UDP-N-acetylmuramoyl-tripeptide--D-alanyl-D-alanine ligase
MELRAEEICAATNGTLLQGNLQAVLRGVSNDSRRIGSGELFVPLIGSNCDGHFFIADAFTRGADAAFIKRQHPLAAGLRERFAENVLIEVDDPLHALGDLAHFWRRQFSIPVVAITGSNGKTTTKEMTWQIVNQKLSALKNPGNWNNLIGLPLSLLQLGQQHQVAILEMGMSARGEIERLAEIAAPDIGVVTNVGPAHLEHLLTIENIMAAKGELFAALGPEDVAVVNQDDERVVSLAQSTRARVLTYGLRAGDVRGIVSPPHRGGETRFTLAIQGKEIAITLPLPGGMFLSNALAAAAVGHALQLRLEDIKQGLEQFQPMPGRMERISMDGAMIINDAYNANPVSMERALQALAAAQQGSRKIAVLGDMCELGKQGAEYHWQAGYCAAQLGIDYLFLYGSFAETVAAGARAGALDERQILIFATKEALAEHLEQTLQHGDWILVKGSRAMGMEQIITLLSRKVNPSQGNA